MIFQRLVRAVNERFLLPEWYGKKWFLLEPVNHLYSCLFVSLIRYYLFALFSFYRLLYFGSQFICCGYFLFLSSNYCLLFFQKVLVPCISYFPSSFATSLQIFPLFPSFLPFLPFLISLLRSLSLFLFMLFFSFYLFSFIFLFQLDIYRYRLQTLSRPTPSVRGNGPGDLKPRGSVSVRTRVRARAVILLSSLPSRKYDEER